MNYVLDIIVLSILAITIITSFKKGFVRSLLEFVSVILAFFIAKTYSPIVSEYISQNIISKTVEAYLSKAASSNANLINTINSISDIFKNINDTEILNELAGIKLNIASQNISVDKIIDSLTQSISNSISSVIAFILVFIVSIIAIKIIIVLIDAIFKLPVIGTINKILGIILGLLKGILFVFVFCLIVSFVVMTGINSKEPLITNEIILQTYILKLFYYNNFISGFLF